MSAVGDSRTSKSRTSHIKQATLIPALLLGSGEGASEEPPILLSSLLPLTPGPGASSLFPFPRLLMPREPAKHRCHTTFNHTTFYRTVSKLRAQWCTVAQTDPLSDSPRNNKQTLTQKMQYDVKTNTRIRRPSKRIGIKIQCR